MAKKFSRGFRKITASGSNALVVVIPIDIVQRNNLKAGDTVQLFDDGKKEMTFRFKDE